eukprot:8119587-Pyramimonas_sp.AAC.1
MCIAPRILKLKQWASDLLTVTRSLVAGSPKGVQLAKVFLHPILERVHKVAPQTMLATYIDDT